MTPPLKYLSFCHHCREGFLTKHCNAWYCSPECRKAHKALGIQRIREQPILNPEWEAWEAQQKKENWKPSEGSAESKQAFSLATVQFFPVPDSKGQADFYSGLMV